MTEARHATDDRLLDLVNDLLSASDRQTVLSHLGDCPPCAERLRVFAAAHARSHARAAETLATLPRAPAVHAIDPTPIRSAVRTWSRPWLAVAAGLIVMSVPLAMRISRGPSPLLPVAAAPLPFPDPSILTRDADAPAMDAAVARGLAAYARGDLAGARRTLASATATGATEQVRRIYLGNSELRTGDARRAVRTLRGVNSAVVPEPWLGELQWSLAVALATSGDSAAADSVRRRLALRSDSIGARARAGWQER